MKKRKKAAITTVEVRMGTAFVWIFMYQSDRQYATRTKALRAARRWAKGHGIEVEK